MKVLITGGASGQLKWELVRTLPDHVALVGENAERLDITDTEAVHSALQQLKPDCVINAAAYTAVDAAESERQAAFAVNHLGVKNLCMAASNVGTRLLHISTDFVFGPADGRPLTPSSPTQPCSVYGKSKLAGEQEIFTIMPTTGLIMRTSWVYSSHGTNFVKTMLKLMDDQDVVGVVADQIGSPTWANGLARAMWQAVEKRRSGVLQWTGAGVASWYDFAMAIYEEGQALGLLDRTVNIIPLRTDQYPTPAERPPYSVMETSHTAQLLDYEPDYWRDELRTMMRELV